MKALHHAWTPRQALDFIRLNTYDAIFLDHDLMFDTVASDVTREIAQMHSKKEYLSHGAIHAVHSANPGGADMMISHLRSAGLTVRRCTFLWQDYTGLVRWAETGTWAIRDSHNLWEERNIVDDE